MRRQGWMAVMPLLVIACGGADPDMETDVAAIEAFIDQAVDVNNAGDITGWVELFAEDGMLLPDGQPPIMTREALEGFAVSRFSRYRPNIQIAADEIQIIGDWAFSRTTVTGTLTPRGGGNPLRVDGKEIALYRRQPNGGWKLARLIANSSR